MISYDVPRSFIENYTEIIERAGRYPNRPRAILSASAWYGRNEFQHWAADSAEYGTLLFGVQHGCGGYGICPYMWLSDHELEITDRYYSWGWQKEDCRSKVEPLTPPQMISRRTLKKGNKNGDILFALSALPRYLYRYQVYNIVPFGKCIEDQLHFVATLPEKLRTILRVRLYQEDHGWDIKERWIAQFPNIRLENWDKRFVDSLHECCLFVSDQLFTTYAESLMANKPTIVFSDPRTMELSPEAHNVFQGLRDVGILHDNPISAARMVEAVYGDLEEWWEEQERQDARLRFCNSLARNAEDPVNEWATEIVRAVS